MKISKRFIGLMVLLAIAAGLGAAWAFAQDANTIYACANPRGILRVVDGPEDCTAAETALDWNIAGAEGPRGPQGEPGPPGATGPAGVLRFYVLPVQSAPITPGSTMYVSGSWGALAS